MHGPQTTGQNVVTISDIVSQWPLTRAIYGSNQIVQVIHAVQEFGMVPVVTLTHIEVQLTIYSGNHNYWVP